MYRPKFTVFIILTLFIFTILNCKRERINPLDPHNPNSDSVLLPPPTGLTATPDYGSVMLSWNAVSDAVKYQIYRDDEQITTVETTSYENAGLTPGNEYKYQVASVHSSGLGGHKSNAVYGTPIKGAKIQFSKYEIYSDDNDDGIVNRGEVIRTKIYLKNIGTEIANGVSASLTIIDGGTYVFLNYKEADFYDLDQGEEDYGKNTDWGSSFWSYQFTVLNNCPYGHTVTFQLDIEDEDGNSCSDTFSIIVEKTNANIVYTQYSIYYDSGGNNQVNPGDMIRIKTYLQNIGTSRANSIIAYLSAADAYVTLNYVKADFYDMDQGEEDYGRNTDWGSSFWSYQFTVSSSCPTPHDITFNLDIDDEDGNSWSDSFTVPVE